MWKNRRRKAKQSKEERRIEVVGLEKQLIELKNIDPKSVERFNQLPLSKATLRALKANKYTEPTLVQKLSLPHTLQGHDVVVDAKTGSGKTLCFVIPILEQLYRDKWDRNSGVAAIIITPTRELAYQIHGVLQRLTQHHSLTSALIIGGKDLAEEWHYIGCFNVLVCTPGRLHQHMKESPNFDFSTLKVLVLDEADLCLSMGFSDKMNDILLELPTARQTLLFSATQTRDVQSLIRSGCNKPIFISLHEHSTVSTPLTLKQSYTIYEAYDKLNFLFSFLTNHKKKKILVFVSTCKQAKFLSYVFTLLKLHMKILCLHGGMKQPRRTFIYNTFMAEQRIVMLATDIVARGLDFSGVDWVVQLDCPEDADTYIHRVGRTARYYRDGLALLVLTPHESVAMLRRLQDSRVPLEQLDVHPGMIASQERRVEDIVCKDPTAREDAQKAFQAYLKNQIYMKDKTIFDVTTIDRDRFARSYGLVCTPRVRFVERALKLRQQQQVARVSAATAARDSSEGNVDTSDDEAQREDEGIGSDEEKVEKEMESEVVAPQVSERALYKNDAIKQVTIVTEQCPFADKFKEIFKTTTELSGPLAVPPTDYSKYLAKGKKNLQKTEQQQDWQSGARPWLSLTEAKAILQENRLKYKQEHKKKIKDRKRTLLRKRKEKRHGRKEKPSQDSGSDEDDSDTSELDPFTQRIIDKLPDPDKIRGGEGSDEEGEEDKLDKRKRDSSLAAAPESRTFKKRRLDESASEGTSDEDDDDYFDVTAMSLQQQEELARTLLGNR